MKFEYKTETNVEVGQNCMVLSLVHHQPTKVFTR